ncbi:MAG TPA: phosphoribosyltransferase family protein [Candidatus Paceibacterota bacterium]|nr:phosphoribosyltransferase family protein [Candidatus Paceibacterota bacterium]
MLNIFNFLLDLLSKKDPFVESLELESIDFWKERLETKRVSNNVLGFFPYREKAIKTAIVEIKARNNKAFLRALTLMVSDVLIEELQEEWAWHNFTPKLIVPIPTSSSSRGFNQSYEIACAFSKNGICSDALLLKTELQKKRHTQAQHELSREKRLRNLKHSMFVKHPEKFQGLDVLVVDDVTTTGATFEEAVRALKSAGARKVLCVALAY